MEPHSPPSSFHRGPQREPGAPVLLERNAGSARSGSQGAPRGPLPLPSMPPPRLSPQQQQRGFLSSGGNRHEPQGGGLRAPKGGPQGGPSKPRGYSMYINCVTWASDSHGLFDYESRNVAKKTYRINCMREPPAAAVAASICCC